MVIARSSNLLGKITILVVVGLCVNPVFALDGSGTEQDPWRIQSLDDFNDFAADANYWDGWTRLETDVNLAGLTYTTAVIAPDTDNSNDSFDGTFFDGSFDGNGKRIFNLNIQGGANDYLGLFGGNTYFGVRNLGLDDCNIIGDDYVGSLVGKTYYGFISNCYSTGSVSGDDYVGGLVGSNHFGGYIGHCHSSGSVIGDEYVGGLVGKNEWSISDCFSESSVDGILYVGGLVGGNIGSVYNCYSTSNVNGLGDDIGGLVGINYGSVSYCYSTGDVSGNWWFTGGLTGANEGSVLNCYSTGDVSGIGFFGGLVGRNGWEDYFGQKHPGYIYNSYSTGFVKKYGGGGLIGYNISGAIEGSFWNIETSGQLESDGGTGLPTEDMQKMATFTDAGWDFINIWNIGENQTYPYLRVYLPSDINKDGIVNFLDFAITANQWMEGVE